MTQKEPEPNKSELTEADNKMITLMATHLHGIDYIAAQVKQMKFPLWQEAHEDVKKQYFMDAWILFRAGWRIIK